MSRHEYFCTRILFKEGINGISYLRLNISISLVESSVNISIWLIWILSANALNIGDPVLKVSPIGSSESHHDLIFKLVVSHISECVAHAVQYFNDVLKTAILSAWSAALPIG